MLREEERNGAETRAHFLGLAFSFGVNQLLAALNRCRLALFRRFFENLPLSLFATLQLQPTFFFLLSHPTAHAELRVGPRLL